MIGTAKDFASILTIDRNVIFPVIHAKSSGAGVPVRLSANLDNVAQRRSWVYVVIIVFQLGVYELFAVIYAGQHFFFFWLCQHGHIGGNGFLVITVTVGSYTQPRQQAGEDKAAISPVCYTEIQAITAGSGREEYADNDKAENYIYVENIIHSYILHINMLRISLLYRVVI